MEAVAVYYTDALLDMFASKIIEREVYKLILL